MYHCKAGVGTPSVEYHALATGNGLPNIEQVGDVRSLGAVDHGWRPLKRISNENGAKTMMNIVRVGTVVVIGAVALTTCACKKNSESTDRKEITRIEAASQPGVSGNYVTPDYEMRGEGYDWVAVSVKHLSADVIWLSVRSRADRKKPTCTFDTKAYRTNDSTFSTVAEGKTVIIKFGAGSVTIATERPEDEAALYFFCSGGATVAGTYKKMDGPLDVTQVDKTTFSRILRLQGIGFHVTSKPKAGKEELEIYPFGLSVDNRSITQLIDGSVADAEIEDLNSDGFPEWLDSPSTRSARSGSLTTGRTTRYSSKEIENERPAKRRGAVFCARNPSTHSQTTLVRSGQAPAGNVGARPDKKHRGKQDTQFFSSEMRKTQNHPLGGFGFSSARNRNFTQLTHLCRVFEMALNSQL